MVKHQGNLNISFNLLAACIGTKKDHHRMMICTCLSKMLKSAQGAISYAGVNIWNGIPPKIRKAESIVTFKKQFKEHLMMAWNV